MNFQLVLELILEMGTLKFFPTIPNAHFALARMACEVASNEDQVRWWVKRMTTLYSEWPGPREFRAVFCAKFKPRDGIEAFGSAVFPEGIPSDRPPVPPPALPPGERTVDPASIDRTVGRLAKLKDLNEPKMRKRLREMPANLDFKPITQEDIEREIEKRKQAQGEAELKDEDDQSKTG